MAICSRTATTKTAATATISMGIYDIRQVPMFWLSLSVW